MQKLLKFPILYPLLIIAAAIVLRVTLSIQGWTSANSDESMWNLLTLHIAYRGEHPTFFYGQHYLGTFEAYVGAVLFRVFEPSVLLMRLEMIGFCALFLVALYALTSRLYTRRFALLVLVLCALGGPKVLQLQTEAVGYPELPLLVTLLFLVAYSLVCKSDVWSWRRRAVVYGLWGVIAGFALWEHVLTAPYVLASASLLMLWRFRDMLRLGLWCVIIGAVIGGWPLIWYNLHAPPGQDSLSVALHMTQLGQDPRYGIIDHIVGTVLVTIPFATGFWSRCLSLHISDHLPLFPTSHPHCIAEQAGWGGGYVVLLILAMAMACMALWYLRRISQWTIDDRSDAIQQSARLFLLIAAVLTLVSYIRGGALVLDAMNGSRYLICTWVSLPAIIWPLWVGADFAKKRWLVRVFLVLRVTSALLLVALLTYGTFGVFSQIPQAQAENSRIEELTTYLQKSGITRFYSEYWTCNRLIFLSREKLICGNTWIAGHEVIHTSDRYKAYLAIVEASSNPAFVYPAGDGRVQALEQKLRMGKISYSHKQIAGYVVCRPSRSVTVT